MIRVCLVEDHTIVRQGLRALIELVDDIEVVGEMSNGEEALARLRAVAPDVMLLDVRMPRLDGIGLLKALRARGALPPTIVLTTFDDDALVIEAIRAGAKGYLLKDVSLEQLTTAIRTVASGGTMIQPAVTQRIVRDVDKLKPQFETLDPPDRLTDREVEILRLMASGYSNREIAEGLDLAEGTVKNHVSGILSKLGVRDRTRAVLKALELGHLK